MTTRPRNRVVVFRLSQDEYRSLVEACGRAGARNLSDFTRSEMLERLDTARPEGRLARRFRALEEVVAAIQVQLNTLLQGGSHADFKQPN